MKHNPIYKEGNLVPVIRGPQFIFAYPLKIIYCFERRLWENKNQKWVESLIPTKHTMVGFYHFRPLGRNTSQWWHLTAFKQKQVAFFATWWRSFHTVGNMTKETSAVVCKWSLFVFLVVQSLSHVWLFVIPWATAHQASLSITSSWSLLKLVAIEWVMPSTHPILCRPLLLPPSIFPSIRVFSKESALCIRWPKSWSFSFRISPSNEHSGLISFRMDWLDIASVYSIYQGTFWLYEFDCPG